MSEGKEFPSVPNNSGNNRDPRENQKTGTGSERIMNDFSNLKKGGNKNDKDPKIVRVKGGDDGGPGGPGGAAINLKKELAREGYNRTNADGQNPSTEPVSPNPPLRGLPPKGK